MRHLAWLIFRIVAIILGGIFLSIFVLGLQDKTVNSVDFHTFWQAAAFLIKHRSPYFFTDQTQILPQKISEMTIDYHQPPWVVLPFISLLVFDEETAHFIYVILSVVITLGAFYGYSTMVNLKGVLNKLAALSYIALTVPFLHMVSLGQLFYVWAFFILGLWLLNKKMDFGAGLAFSFAFAKPQVTGLIIGLLLLNNLRQRRYLALVSFGGWQIFGLLISFFLLPNWIGEMVAHATTYRYFQTVPSLNVLFQALWAGPVATVLYIVIALSGLLTFVFFWWQNCSYFEQNYLIGLGLTINFALAYYTHSDDYVLLALPLLLLFGRFKNFSGVQQVVVGLFFIFYFSYLYLTISIWGTSSSLADLAVPFIFMLLLFWLKACFTLKVIKVDTLFVAKTI